MIYLKKFENIQPEKFVKYYENGNIETIKYFLNGKYHREDGPAVTGWYKNGKKRSELYIINGILHRKDGPAYTYWSSDGKIHRVEYHLNDRLHREDGPAIQNFDINGKILHTTFVLNGFIYDRKKWIEELKDIGSPHYKEQQDLYNIEQNIKKYNL